MDIDFEKVAARKKQWEEGPLRKAMSRFPYLKEPPSRFCTPLDNPGFDFLKKVGFPGQYPFTAGTYPLEPLAGLAKLAGMARRGATPSEGGLTRAGLYSGYGRAEDTRDFYKQRIARGGKVGPNLAFDLPT